jgi:hypothetical protein
LKVYDPGGRLVRTVFTGTVDVGGCKLWDGVGDDGVSLSSGLYFAEARMGSRVAVHKFTLIR